ncbi:L-seryl-tRNA(Sec) kinase isoform X1 [Prionailurus iriomotensis]
MKTAEDARGVHAEGPRKLGLCLLCGLPAAGKSTFARALSPRLRQERGWAVGVVAYDDVMPDAFLEEASARPLSLADVFVVCAVMSVMWEGMDSPSQWKLLRQELLKYLEHFLLAVINGCQMSTPPNRTEAMWEDFITCLKDQDLISSAAPEARSCYLLTKTAVSRPLVLILDDNFYYQSMRYEVYQLARKYSLGFCQLFLDCSLETCLQRNGQRPQALPAETIHLMGRKLEKPNPEKNAWEHNSLTIESSECSSEASLKLIDLLLTALENPVKYIEDNVEQKGSRQNHLFNQPSSSSRSDAPKDCLSDDEGSKSKERVLPFNLKLLAEELNKLKAEFLEDLRQGNKKYLCFPETTNVSDAIAFFHHEKDNIVQKYFSKH